MSETNERYPIDFKKSSGPEVRKAFSGIGLEDNTNISINNARKKVQQFTIDNQLLLALHRPTFGDREYFHPGYAEAGLRGAEELPPRNRAKWLAKTAEQLKEYAETPEAQEIIAAAVGKYYREIGKRAVLLGAFGDTPVIRGHRLGDADGRPPLDYIGISHQGLRSKAHDAGRVDSNDPTAKKYFPIESIISDVGWTIPGVEKEKSPVRDMIWESLGDNSESVVDPRALFALSSIGTKRGPVPASEIFQTKDLK